MSNTIGFVGVGNMGSRIANTVLNAGYDVIVFDIDEERVTAMVDAGASASESPQGLARDADIVMSSLPNTDAVETAYLGDDGVLEGVSEDQLLIDLGTTKPSTTEAVAAEARERGAVLIDAPVIGTPSVADRAELMVVVGGPKDGFERAKPILTTIGEEIWHVGRVGDGHRTKLINNTVMHGNVVIAAEALALADAAGLDPELVFNIVNSGIGGSEIMQAKMGRALEGDFDPQDGSPTHNARKSVKYALDMAFDEDVAMHTAAAVEENYGLATAAGEGEKDYSVIFQVLKELGDSNGSSGERR